tara:strand:+ start:213 stop:395 length:183 start_codon:yes stop_codon:yes gene_type:complete
MLDWLVKEKIMDDFTLEQFEDTISCGCHLIPTELIEQGVQCDECSYHDTMMEEARYARSI